jgi:hypothetical protein
MNVLENDPRFRHMSATMDKFLASGEGRLMMEFVETNAPVIVTSKGMDTGALTGAENKGWRDCMAFIKRLSIYKAPPPQMPDAEFLKSDKPPTTN